MSARAVSPRSGPLRAHAPFIVLLAAGAFLRAVTQLAYVPALIYIDSWRYLLNADELVPRKAWPLGYPLLLKLLTVGHGLLAIPLTQHLMGLAMGILVYALLLRLGVPRAAATLAAAPVLLDAYQLNIEQYIVSETLFELLLLGGCAAILWRPRPSPALAALAGLLLALATLTRSAAMLVAIPAVISVILLARRPLPAAAFIAACATPIVGYAIWFHSLYGQYATNSYGGYWLYGRVTQFVDCRGLSLPGYERVLCPPQPLGQRYPIDVYLSSKRRSPLWQVRPPAGVSRNQAAGDFARRAIRHQPLTYARAVTSDFLRGFAPTRTQHRNEVAISRWQFQATYPIYRKYTAAVARRYDMRPRARPTLARALRGYQRFGYVPNTLLGLALVAALLAVLGVGRARRSGLRSAAFLFGGVAVTVLLVPVAVNQFSWRYTLPQLILLPPAGAIGMTALLRPVPVPRGDRRSRGAHVPAGAGGRAHVAEPAPP